MNPLAFLAGLLFRITQAPSGSFVVREAAPMGQLYSHAPWCP